MSDSKEIIKKVMSDEKLLNSRAFTERVYRDEPIIRTAAQLKTSRFPAKINLMKAIAFSQEAYWKTSAWLFYKQGKFMEEFEDDFPMCADFVKYYPSYRDLTNEQLRSYFTWRTWIRSGVFPKAPLPFVFMYIYELINCVGNDEPLKCFEQLKSFCNRYKSIDDTFSRYTDIWLKDMVVYYGLPAECADDLGDIKYDKALLKLIHWEEHSEEELFDAICELSAYQLKKSRFYAAYPDDIRTVLVRSFVSLSEFFRDKRKKSLCDKLFGNIVECSYNMFASAIFYDKEPLRNCDYTMNEIHSFVCQNGKWKCRKYYGNRNRNGKLGEFVKAVDSLMREKEDFRYKLSYTDISKTTVKIIQAEIDHLYEEKKRKEAARIEIDLSKLSSIRAAADSTREKLIVDEDTEEETVQEQPKKTEAPAANTADELPIDSGEICFMRALLYGGNISEAAKSCGRMVSILADSINDKLFDLFSDTVIDFSAGEPALIEDYTDELRQMIPKE